MFNRFNNNNYNNNEKVRKQVVDYYGTAMFNGNPMAMMELENVKRMNNEQLQREARKLGIIKNK